VCVCVLDIFITIKLYKQHVENNEESCAWFKRNEAKSWNEVIINKEIMNRRPNNVGIYVAYYDSTIMVINNFLFKIRRDINVTKF